MQGGGEGGEGARLGWNGMGWKLYMEIIQVERRTQKQQSKAKPKGREEMEKGCIPFPVMQAMQATLRPQYNHNTMKKERKKKRQFMAARPGSIAGQGRAAPESIQNVCSLFFPLLPPHPLYLPSLSLCFSFWHMFDFWQVAASNCYNCYNCHNSRCWFFLLFCSWLRSVCVLLVAH